MTPEDRLRRAAQQGNYKLFLKLASEFPQCVREGLAVGYLERVCMELAEERGELGHVEIANFLFDKGIRIDGDWFKVSWKKVWDTHETLLRKRKLSQL